MSERDGDVEALLGLAPLAIGQRVRVRLSGECDPRYSERYSLHESHLDGCVGRIYVNDRSNAAPGHRYIVVMDDESFGYFARTELEHIP